MVARFAALALIVLAAAPAPVIALRVLVTGAGGRTGSLVFEKLKNDYDTITPVGLVKSKKAVKRLQKAGATPEEIIKADVTVKEELASAMTGVDAVVLCTSAVPKIRPFSIVKLLVKKVLRRPDPGRPAFKWSKGGTPEEVDWLGAKAQIDAAKEAGVGHLVFVSSMGGTQPENFLNSIGRRKDGSAGDILLWKRKAERYLIESGIGFTIIHPGGLVDEPPSQRELVVGVDDELLKNTNRQVPRSDVARVCASALVVPEARDKSFDLASKPVGEGEVTKHAKSVFDQLANRTCDYSNVLPDTPSIFADSAP